MAAITKHPGAADARADGKINFCAFSLPIDGSGLLVVDIQAGHRLEIVYQKWLNRSDTVLAIAGPGIADQYGQGDLGGEIPNENTA